MASILRRTILQSGVALAAGLLAPSALAAGVPRFKSMAFDGFAIFDPMPIGVLAEAIYPGNGSRLIDLWRIRQFEYTWLRTITGEYADFMQVTEDSLLYACNALKLDLRGESRDRLLGTYMTFSTWPDVLPVLRDLKTAGVRLSFLSNLTPAMLAGSIKASALDGLFEHVISTDKVKSYKPSPAAYQLGLDAFGLPKSEILFVAFAGWDAAGAKAFGYPTFWVNRLGLPSEEIGHKADMEGRTLEHLKAFVLS
jgi:2-haloacid dehalogenase